MRLSSLLTVASLASLLTGCLEGVFDLETLPDPPPGTPGDTGTPSTTTPSPTTPTPTTPGAVPAADVEITRISVYQGVERPLWVEGAPSDVTLPVIAGRDALVRVFVSPLEGLVSRPVRAVLTVVDPSSPERAAGPLVLEAQKTLAAPSTDESLDSTFVFDLLPEDLGPDTELRVEVLEIDPKPPGEEPVDLDDRPVVFDSALDLDDGLPVVEGRDLEVVLLPFQYDADGSGRVPDTSSATVAALQDKLEAMYPVRSVTVTVEAPVPWDQDILRDGTGFAEALSHVVDLRGSASVSRNTYFYGLFDPAPTFAGFCGQACVAGLSYLVTTTSYPSLQASVGIGYTSGDVAAETLVHELAHAHGRAHAPCGSPLNLDDDFPYAGGTTGVWGYDRRSDALLDPGATFDMMGYCDPIWVSDYTFEALHERIETLANPMVAFGSRTVTRVRIGAGGGVLDQGEVDLDPGPLPGEPVTVTVVDATGAPAGDRPARRIPYSHLEGGLVLLEEMLPPGFRVVSVQDR